MTILEITESAQAHLLKLTKMPEHNGQFLYLEALDPDTPYAEAGLSFETIGPEHTEDLILSFEGFSLFIHKKSVEYFEGAVIDFKKVGMNEELSVAAPKLQPVDVLGTDATLEDKVQFLIHKEINPSLASHGGMIHLVEVTADNEVVIQFLGGCQGCGMAGVTLKQGIEESLLSKLPDIKAIIDATDHEAGKNPYY